MENAKSISIAAVPAPQKKRGRRVKKTSRVSPLPENGVAEASLESMDIGPVLRTPPSPISFNRGCIIDVSEELAQGYEITLQTTKAIAEGTKEVQEALQKLKVIAEQNDLSVTSFYGPISEDNSWGSGRVTKAESSTLTSGKTDGINAFRSGPSTEIGKAMPPPSSTRSTPKYRSTQHSKKRKMTGSRGEGSHTASSDPDQSVAGFQSSTSNKRKK